MSDLSDDELIRMYRDGDLEAFDVLFDRHHRTVFNFARHMLGDPAGAEEVTQETFLAVSRSVKTYEARGRARAWILGIARYRCIARLESQRVRRAFTAASGLDIVEPASPQPTPPERAVADETEAAVRRAMGDLPELQREAIVLYAFEHMAYREIADALDAPVNTVKTLIHRARAALARALLAHRRGTRDAV